MLRPGSPAATGQRRTGTRSWSGGHGRLVDRRS